MQTLKEAQIQYNQIVINKKIKHHGYKSLKLNNHEILI